MPYLSIEGLCRGQQHYMQWNNDLILIMIRGPLLRAFRITVSFHLQNQSLRKELLWPLLHRWGNWGLVRLLISPESHGWRKVWTGEGTGKYTNKHSELAHGFSGLEMIIYTKSSSRVPDKWLALNNSYLVLLGSRLSINIIWFNFNTTLWDRCYSVHFVNGEPNVQRGLVPPSRPHSWRLRGWPGTQAPLSPFLCGQLRLGAHKHFPGNALLLISCWWYVYEPISWRLLVKAFSAASARAHLPLRNTCTVGMLRTGISEPMWALPLNSKGTKTYRTYLGLPHPHHFFFPKEKWKNLIITSIYHPTVLITNLFLHSVTDTSSGKHIEIN